MKKITKSKQKHLAKTYKKHFAKTYKKHKKHLAKTYRKKYLRKTYKKHKFFLQKGGMVADPPEPDNCSICFSSLTDSPDSPTKTTHCEHTFHEQCLQDWLLRSHTCPLCRGPVDPANPANPLDPNIDADTNIMRQAFELCQAGSLYMLQVLLHEHPFHVNVIQTEGLQTGWTLLHVAAFNGNMGIVNMLITRGVYSNARTPTMLLASDIARNQGHAAVAVFIDRAIAANVAWYAAARAQMMREERAEAARRPADSIRRAFRLLDQFEFMRVSVMLEAGIINATAHETGTGDNWTLLHLAASRGQMRLVQELLWRGASARALSRLRRETPAQLVRRVRANMFREIAAFLEAVERVEIDAELAMAAATPATSIVDDYL
jgi:hypothetical protein